ncbi:GHKL domain-containing protein [Lactobacillus intestinalis]|uniref:GHKL domain-containing protein n=1 Tax=Lactobacillus intestinalis TaxID=151781 RepID=UPI003F4D6613
MEEVVLVVFLNIFSGLADVWCFFEISRIESKKRQILFLCIANIFLGLLLFIGNIGVIFTNILEILLFVLYLRKNNTLEMLFGSIILVCTLDLLVDIVSDMITQIMSFTLVGQLSLRFLLMLMMIVAIKLGNGKIYNYLANQNNKIFVGILVYTYISTLSISIIYIQSRSFTPLTLFFSLCILLQTIFAIFIYREMTLIQKKLLNKKDQEKLEQEQHQLEEYTSYLEKSQDDLRAFRHDYKNILNSLKVSAQEGNVQEVVQKLDKYTETTLNSAALLKYKDVNHIHIKSIKSIIISKLTELYNLDIQYNFECRNNIHNLPHHIDELDLVRIIGITFDNAIEESKALIGEKHNIRSAEVQIMVYSDGPGEFEYEIRNRIQNKKISTSQIQQRGFTTKKNHKGLGLANIKEIENKYPDMSISYTIQDGWFDFYMTIDTEDGEENE